MRAWFPAFGLIFLSPAVFAGTYTVAPDGSGDFPTIQAAIDAAADGDAIALTDGVFTGAGNRDLDCLGKAITIGSQSGIAEACVIRPEGSETEPHRGINFVSGESGGSVLREVTIEGGWAVYPERGGAVRCDGGGSPRLVGCVFAANHGSAVAAGVDCAPDLADCRFIGNRGPAGGAIDCDRGGLTLARCDFVENASEWEGGAVRGYQVLARIEDCRFVRNAAPDAPAVAFYDQSAVEVRDCLFEENAATGSGGALTFWLSRPNLVVGCTFVGNTAGQAGAAIWSEKVSDTTVRNCTFWDNASPDGTIVAGHMRFRIENSIIAADRIGPGVASYYDYAELSCCDVFGNAGGDWVGSIADQFGVDGNIGADPLFCDPENADFRLDRASPCAPPNTECDLIGAWPVACGETPAPAATWGAIKSRFRDPPDVRRIP
jgi:hypothetical protein